MASTLAAQQKVSKTAYDCAAVRALTYVTTNSASCDYLAMDMARGRPCPLKTRVLLGLVRMGAVKVAAAAAARMSPGVEVFMFARTAVPDDLVREALDADAEAQVVVLGAGLDTTGLRIGAERRKRGAGPGRFFEVDLPATQEEKTRRVERIVRARRDLRCDHIRYVPCSFGEQDLGEVLRSAGFERSRPTVWIWSGVVHYLTDAAVGATVREIVELSGKGSTLFLDFILLEAYQRPAEYGFAGTKARFDAYGEVMSFGFHEGTAHVSGWLSEQGLGFVRSYTHEDMAALYQQKTRSVPPSRGTPWSNLCVASL